MKRFDLQKFDFSALANYIDFLNFEQYFHYVHGKSYSVNDALSDRNMAHIQSDIDCLISMGVPAGKIVLFVNFDASFHMMLDNTYDKFIRIISYNQVCQELNSDGGKNWNKSSSVDGSVIVRDNIKNLLILYESRRRIANDVKFGIQRELGGFMTSPIQHDDSLELCEIDDDTFNDYDDSAKLNVSFEKISRLLNTINTAIELSLAQRERELSSAQQPAASMNSTGYNAPFANSIFNRFSLFCVGVYLSFMQSIICILIDSIN